MPLETAAPRYSFTAHAPKWSNNTIAIASLAVQHLMGEELNTEMAESSMRLFRVEDATADQLIAHAKKYAEGEVGKAAAKYLEGKDPSHAITAIAQQAELDAIAAAKEGIQNGLKMGPNAMKAQLVVIAAAKEDTGNGLKMGEMVRAVQDISSNLFRHIKAGANNPIILGLSKRPVTIGMATIAILAVLFLSRIPTVLLWLIFVVVGAVVAVWLFHHAGRQAKGGEPDANQAASKCAPSAIKVAPAQTPPSVASPVPSKLPPRKELFSETQTPVRPPATLDLPSRPYPCDNLSSQIETNRAPPPPPMVQYPLMPPYLHVQRADILQALTLIKNVGQPRPTDQLIFSFDGERLHFDLCGMSTSIPATGIWDCQVRAKPAFLNPLIQVPFDEDSWMIHAEYGYLHFGASFHCPCEIQPPWQATIQLPLDGNDAMLLAVKLKYSAQDIEASGLKYSVAKADGIITKRIQSAINALSEYGLQAEDVRTLVDQRIRSSDAMKII